MRIRGVRQSYDQDRRRSKLMVEWRASDLSVQPITPGVAALTRPDPVSVSDERGVTYTAPAGLPAWTMTDGAAGLRLGDEDSITFPFPGPEPCRVACVFVERGTISGADGTVLWAIGSGTNRLDVTRQSGPRYRVSLIAGGESVTAETPNDPTTVGDVALIVVDVDADGRVRIGVQPEPSVPMDLSEWSAPNANGLPTEWNAPTLEVNARGGENHGDVELRAVWAASPGDAPHTVHGWDTGPTS